MELCFEQVVHRIAPESKLRRAWNLRGGISAEMTALEIEQGDGRIQRVIIRCPGDSAYKRNAQAAANEFKLLQALQRVDLPTQRPLLLDSSGEIFPLPYLVIEYIEGQPDFAPVDLATYLWQFAAQLAMIHDIDYGQMGLSFLPNQATGLHETIGEDPPMLNQSLEEGRIRHALKAAWPFAQPNPPVVRHGDFWPGNILWRNGKIAAVIDWEDALIGDPLTDLAITRFDILCIFGSDAMGSFTQHYLSYRVIDTTTLPFWDLYAALRFVRLAGSDLAGWAAFYPPFGRPDITEQSLRLHYRFFIEQAFQAITVS